MLKLVQSIAADALDWLTVTDPVPVAIVAEPAVTVPPVGRLCAHAVPAKASAPAVVTSRARPTRAVEQESAVRVQ
jgi:hypothetical protein